MPPKVMKKGGAKGGAMAKRGVAAGGKTGGKRMSPNAGKPSKHVGFAPGTKAAPVPKGVVAAADEAKKAKQAAEWKKEQLLKAKREQEMIHRELNAPSDDDEDDVSDSDIDSDDVSSQDGDVPTGGKKGEKAKKRTKAVEFRYLPSQFQEPELKKYLSQFGPKVLKVVCLRHKDSDSSRGIALATFETPSIISTVIDECDGMLLGGRTIRCKRVFLKRDLPHPKLTKKRYLADQRRRTRGAKMTRFVNEKHQNTVTTLKTPKSGKVMKAKPVETKSIVGALIKYSRREKDHNKALAAMGINYAFTSFQDQIKQVPKDKFEKKEKRGKRERGDDDEVEQN